MLRFVSGMAASLSSVIHLAISTLMFWHMLAPNMITIVSSFLAPLAKACPLLQTLEVDGDIGPEALAAFGASCSRLSRLILSVFSLSSTICSPFSQTYSMLKYRAVGIFCVEPKLRVTAATQHAPFRTDPSSKQ